MILAAAALLALALAPAQPAADAAGLYVASQMEMAGALELQPGGRFRYRLDYGAVSEQADGDWVADGSAIRLTSNPMPKLPLFTLVRDEPAPAGQLFVALDESHPGWKPLEVEVTPESGGQAIRLSAGDDGRVEMPDGVRAARVKLVLPVYESAGELVKLASGSGHRLVFRLEPNDLGIASFRSQPLTLDRGAIIMHRYETTIVFRRAER